MHCCAAGSKRVKPLSHTTRRHYRRKKMSINWVMIENNKPVELPSELFHYTKGDRISIELKSITDGAVPTVINCPSGELYLSNQRLVYIGKTQVTFKIPQKGDQEFKTFAVDLAKLQYASAVTPWFGANGWQAVFPPIKNGKLDPDNVLWKVKLTFKDGGAFEFVEKCNAACMDAIHGESLPAYSDL